MWQKITDLIKILEKEIFRAEHVDKNPIEIDPHTLSILCRIAKHALDKGIIDQYGDEVTIEDQHRINRIDDKKE
jgi:hypothetical protein